jgi:xylulokinase
VRTVLACDLGGTSFRAALIDQTGETLFEHAVVSPTGVDRLGWSEIDPADWWAVFVQAVTAVADQAGELFDDVEAIAMCGVTRTQVFLGRDGRVLRNAVTWKDTRAAGAVKRLLAAIPEDHPQRGEINSFHPLARLAWLREEEPLTFASLKLVIDPKDYLNLRLTGVAASDPISMARLNASNEIGPDGTTLLQLARVDESVLPPLLHPASSIGPVLENLPGVLGRLAKRPVFCGSTDTWVGVAGLGALQSGFAYNISGTTEVFGAVGPESVKAEGLMTVDWGGGLHQIGGPGQNGADTVTWLLSLLEKMSSDYSSVAQAMEGLLQGRRDSQPLLFLPYLQGERTPYWDANLRGAFVGLNRRHGATDMAWAVLEGIAFLNRVVLERAESAIGEPIREVRFGGGAASNRAWCQAKADIWQRPVLVGTASQPGLLGAAIIAWFGLGAFPSLADAQDAMVQIGHRYEPVSARAAAYSQLYAAYRQTEEALRPISHKLASAGSAYETLPGVHSSPFVTQGTRS